MIISVIKEAIAHNLKHGWRGLQRAKPIRLCRDATGHDPRPYLANEIGIYDRAGNLVAQVISSPDGHPFGAYGTHVVITTLYAARVIQ